MQVNGSAPCLGWHHGKPVSTSRVTCHWDLRNPGYTKGSPLGNQGDRPVIGSMQTTAAGAGKSPPGLGPVTGLKERSVTMDLRYSSCPS